MKIVRFSSKGKIKYGVWEGNAVRGYKGSPFSKPEKFSSDGTLYDLCDIRLLAPCEPSKIVCLGLNYRSHIEETGFKEPDEPLMFLKPSTSVIGPEDYIVLPKFSVKSRIDYEGEVGVVIGKVAKDVAEKNALEYILGYTCVNDVSARYYQKKDVQWTRAKGFDTFCPIGPCIANLENPEKIGLQTVVNGQTRQSSDTGYLIFTIRKLVSFISSVMTLLPGDVISTGTPEGIGPIEQGDIVEIKVEGVGTLKNYVKDKV